MAQTNKQPKHLTKGESFKNEAVVRINTKVYEDRTARMGIRVTAIPKTKPVYSQKELTMGSACRVLRKGKGFPSNFRSPLAELDLAQHLCDEGFGRHVSDALTNFHRPWITLDGLKASAYKFTHQLPKRRVNEELWRTAVNSVRNSFEGKVKPKYPMTKLLDVFDIHPIPKSTSPGLPYVLDGIHKTKGEAWDYDKYGISNLWNSIEAGLPTRLPDCMIAGRSQLCSSEEKNKVRAVWGYPLSVIAQEAVFGYNLIEAIKNQELLTNFAYGAEIINNSMLFLDREMEEAAYKNYHTTFIGSDFSGFDSTISAWMIRDAFKILADFIDFSKEQDFDGNVYDVNPYLAKKRWKAIVNYFINTPLRFSDGTRFMKMHGVPSGSLFTNIIDGLVNMLTCRYVMAGIFGRKLLFEIYLGDDALVAVSSPIDLKDLAKEFKKIGLVINTDKTIVTKLPSGQKFLGHTNFGGNAIYSERELLASLLMPERGGGGDWSQVGERAIGLGITSMGYHHDFTLIVRETIRFVRAKTGSEPVFSPIDNYNVFSKGLLNRGVKKTYSGEIAFRIFPFMLGFDSCKKKEKGVKLSKEFEMDEKGFRVDKFRPFVYNE